MAETLRAGGDRFVESAGTKATASTARRAAMSEVDIDIRAQASKTPMRW
jgi:hypothetical protein